MVTEIVLMSVFIFLSAVFSGSEIGFYRTSKIRLRVRAKDNMRGVSTLLDLLAEPSLTISSVLVGNNITHYMVVILLTRQLRGLGLRSADFWSTIILSPVLLVFAEILPKVLFERNSEALMCHVGAFLKICRWLFSPVLLFLHSIMALLGWVSGQPTEAPQEGFSSDKFRFFLQKSSDRGVISTYQHKMASNVMRLRSLNVGECMVPMKDVVMVKTKDGMDEVRKRFRDNRYSRLPLFSEQENRITGIINVIDLISADTDDVSTLSRPAVRLMDDSSLVEALYSLQREGQQMAVITDSDGNDCGIVTIKDLVEQIVGRLEEW